MCTDDSPRALPAPVLHDVEPAIEIDLEPVDSVVVTTLMDNVFDALMPDQGPARRVTLGSGPRRPSPLMTDGLVPGTLIAEHGFSVLVTIAKGGAEHRFLFDTGASPDGLMRNMQWLDIDPGSIEAIVCSHGHFDHYGGLIGFSRRGWRILEHTDASVTLGLTSPAGEDGYPGALEAACTYRLVDPGTLSIHMTAESDLPTIVNFAHHSYFTLNYGHSIRDHRLQIDADHYTPTDRELIPTGGIVSVADTAFDFRSLRPIADVDISYDINFVLHRAQAGLCRAARLLPAGGGITVEVYTTEPGLQFYDGSYLGASHPGLDGRPHFPHAGLCLEPGRFPDGPNHPNFPSPVLRPGEVYRQTTEYRFVNTD